MSSSAQQLIWDAAGRPPPKWPLVAAAGVCATCGLPLTEGVHRKDIESETYTQHADYMKFGDFNCPACAWLHSYPKPNHRNVCAIGDRLFWPVLGADSVTEDRPHWATILHLLRNLPAETLVVGCITTDPKPRLWPRYRLATIGAFGLYVHAPDYDVSGFLRLDLAQLQECSLLISRALTEGYSKRAVNTGILTDFRRAAKSPSDSLSLEAELASWRQRREFIPALVTTGLSKKEENG